MNSNKKHLYQSPQVSMTALCVEGGFAASTKKQWFENEKNSSNIEWGYSTNDETWG